MKKKILSLALTLAMCLGLTVSAFAADLTGPQLAPNTWGKGPSLTLKGVSGERAVETDPRYIYDVAVGGSLELDMPYPAGTDRVYIFNSFGVYAAPDYTEFSDDRWDLPEEFKNGMVDPNSGKTRFVYNFTEADMGQQDGFNKVFRIGIFWSNVGGGYTDDEDGSVCFGIRVVPAGEETSTSYQVSSWAKDRVAVAVEDGLAASSLGNDYRVNITRAQFAATAVKLYEAMTGETLAPVTENPFSDTTDPVILQAADMGFVSGVGDGKFDPGALVTREQAAVMLSSVFTKLGGELPAVDATSFADNGSIAGWARNAVAFMNSKEIITGVGNNNFAPKDNASIEQALLIALKMFETLK